MFAVVSEELKLVLRYSSRVEVRGLMAKVSSSTSTCDEPAGDDPEALDQPSSRVAASRDEPGDHRAITGTVSSTAIV